MTRNHFALLARYNAWANDRIYACAARLPEADYFADRGAFFGSLHGTLSHVLVGDRIWMHRFTKTGDVHDRLDARPYASLVDLAAARRAEDARIVSWVDGLDDETLAGTLRFRPITHPIEVSEPFAATLAHVFNHQTHHRGQAHALLTLLAGRDAAPALDLLLFTRERQSLSGNA